MHGPNKNYLTKSRRAARKTSRSFVRTANKFKSEIKVTNLSTGSDDVNAKSILRILGLGVHCGHIIRVSAEGEDEVQAIQNYRHWPIKTLNK
jgi:phosphotransferase system HPr (HPr) family protein